jgi:hypothetical protein
MSHWASVHPADTVSMNTTTHRSRLVAKYDGMCCRCYSIIEQGSPVQWDKVKRLAYHRACTPQPPPTLTHNARLVVGWLEAKADSGQPLNDFEAGLLGQWRHKHYLSDKQVACMVRKRQFKADRQEIACPT